ncbi:MAG: hypothetical protein HQM07_08965 [Zetaproteobacteria bacterium]|nr:hypothetical protein [Zetaproteobacteria bacterium]
MKYWLTVLLTLCLGANQAGATSSPPHDRAITQFIANKIFENECSGKNDNLTTWNHGENFASLGIGHFIWYPKHQSVQFHESFPELLTFMHKKGVHIPHWLQRNPHNPWANQKLFYAAKAAHDPEFMALQNFLIATKDMQMAFIIHRFQSAIPRLIRALPKDQKKTIETMINDLSSSPNGLYALVDYVNFKGEGLKTSEQYQGQGWGLLQVLQRMIAINESNHYAPLPSQFSEAASQVLQERVQHADPKRHEERWLKGWMNRVHSYKD